MSNWKSIVEGDTVSFPAKGSRVRIPNIAHLTCLAGVQFKMGMHSAVEGTVVDVQGIASTEAARDARRFAAIQFSVRTDAGVVEKRTVAKADLVTVEVPS